MTNSKNIAILFPIYSGDSVNYLNQAIDSIINQDYPGRITFIFCIDGPISEELKACYNSINNAVILELKTNQGLATNLNQGIQYALENNYSFIARMDADDISTKDRIRKQYDFFINNPTASIVGTGCNIIDKDNNLVGQRIPKSKIYLKDLFISCPIIHPSVMFRSSLIKSIGHYSKHYKKSQDYDLWFRITKAGHIIHTLQEPLLYFRYDPALINRRKKEQLFNISIKFNHITSNLKLFYVLPNILILLIPELILKYLLKLKLHLKNF
ncbi:MAG: glycosyltransferase [Bdellovibrionales bacterium]|nr:glycosyltransferase [Bdellovibrionales bacterium]